MKINLREPFEVLNLECPIDVSRAEELDSKGVQIYWVCAREPKQSAHALLEDYQGLYIRQVGGAYAGILRVDSKETKVELEQSRLPDSDQLKMLCREMLLQSPFTQVGLTHRTFATPYSSNERIQAC